MRREYAFRIPRVGNNVERSVHVESRDPSSAETRRCPVECLGQSSRIKLPVLIGDVGEVPLVRRRGCLLRVQRDKCPSP